MTIEFTCQCGKQIVCDDAHAGKRAKCNACGATLQIPLSDPALSIPHPQTDLPIDSPNKRGNRVPRPIKKDLSGFCFLLNFVAALQIIVGMMLIVVFCTVIQDVRVIAAGYGLICVSLFMCGVSRIINLLERWQHERDLARES